MKKQDFNHHTRIDPAYHYVGTFFVFVTLIGSITNVIFTIKNEGEILGALVLFTASICIVLIFGLFRLYSMKVQDRVIRMEENFRYYRLTGNVLPTSLTIKQVVALRFASDEEIVSLVETAVKEQLMPVDIKKQVNQWREDTHRV
ncbi:MAG: DUF6526 family protein [Bacillaceae bacterium]